MGNAIAFVLKGYPRLSETFIAKEIAGLERLGLNITIVSLRHPTDKKRHPVHGRIHAPVLYLPEYLYQEPIRVMRAWWRVRRRPTYGATKRLWLKDLWRDKTPNRIRRFGQALVLAAEMPGDVTRLHAHFLHTPGSVARYAATLCAMPWSVSAHAKDVWTIPTWEVQEKIQSTHWLACCSQAAFSYLTDLAEASGDSDKIHLMYHGLDLNDFRLIERPSPNGNARRDGSQAQHPVQLLSVGRAVPKKGYPDLLEALAGLPADCHWHLTHIGGGPLLSSLQAQAQQLNLQSHITWRGSLAQGDVLAAYRDADIFVLASRVEADGDRDGLPNVLLEAGSQGLALAATEVSGIPELVSQEQTGLLSAQRDPRALTANLQRLITDPQLRHRLGTAVQQKISEQFDDSQWISALAAQFGRNTAPDHCRQKGGTP